MKLMASLKSKLSPSLTLLVYYTFQFHVIVPFFWIYGFSLTAMSQEIKARQYDVAFELRDIKGVPEQSDLKEPVYIRLENNQVNLSSFFQKANTLLDQSDTDNTSFMNRDLDSILAYSQELCDRSLRASGQADDCKSNAEMMIETQKTQMLERQSRRVLFPRSYREDIMPSQSKIRARVEQIRNYYINKGGCRSSYCADFDVLSTLLYGSPTHYGQVLDILNESKATKNCFTSIFREMNEVYWYWNDPFSSMPSTCQNLRGSDKTVCDQMQSDFRRVTNRIEDMIKEIQPNQGEIHLSLSCYSSNALLSGLKDVLSEIETNTTSCENYATGESRSPQHHQSRSGTYSIKKEPDGNYTVTIPIIFTPANDYDGDVPTDQIHPRTYKVSKNVCKKQVLRC